MNVRTSDPISQFNNTELTFQWKTYDARTSNAMTDLNDVSEFHIPLLSLLE